MQILVVAFVVAAMAWWILAPSRVDRDLVLAAGSLDLTPHDAEFRGDLSGRPLTLTKVNNGLRLEIGGELPGVLLSRRFTGAGATPVQILYRAHVPRLDSITLDGTGDPLFDARFLVSGDEAAFLAAWTPEARRRALDLDAMAGIEIDADGLALAAPSTSDFVAIARAAAGLAAQLELRRLRISLR